MQAATAYTKEQREGLLAAREALFRRMHQILEQRERLVATLQAGFPSTDTEHANAPLYVAVRPCLASSLHSGLWIWGCVGVPLCVAVRAGLASPMSLGSRV